MKKIITTATAFFLIVSCLLPMANASAVNISNVEPDPIFEIGLFYGLNALPAANLQNATGLGSGYYLGYYDQSTRQFYNLYETDEVYLTIVKDKALWVTSSNVYYDTQPSSYKCYIGPYNLQLTASFPTLTEANNAVNAIINIGYKAFPAYLNGAYRVRIGDYLTQTAANEALPIVASKTGYSLEVCGNSTSCYSVTITGTDTIIFEFDTGVPFGIKPRSVDGSKTQTWFKGYKYYGGFEYQRVNGNDITVSNIVSLHDYVKGVIPYEMSNSWPIEALKAQALCAKSYAMTNVQKHKSLGFDLCNTTDCQVYYGMGSANETTNRAVDETYGYFVTYQGSLAQTYYHSSSGGATEDVENIWGSSVPYLKGVEDKYLTVMSPYSFDITLDQITSILQQKGYTSQKIIDYYISELTPMGNVKGVAFVTASGQILNYNSKERPRTILNNTISGITIKSNRFSISTFLNWFVNGSKMSKALQNTYAIGGNKTVQTLGNKYTDLRLMTGSGLQTIDSSLVSYQVNGTGSGHNVGMSQWGANAMAKQGFTYDEILKFYFTGVEIKYAGG